MATSLHSRVRYKMDISRDNALKFLKLLPEIEIDYSIPKRSKRIETILPKHDVDAIYQLKKNPYAQNRYVRNAFERAIPKAPPRKKGEMFVWIVHDWGRIGSGHKGTRQWGYELKNFDEEEILRFVNDNDDDRVSSWSKILAFANQREHAIYDSRSTISLNIILDELNMPYRFYMPDTQNTKIPEAIDHVRKWVNENTTERVRNKYRYYREYIELLQNVVKHAHSSIDILELEARLYAHAPALAKRYIEKHGIEIKKETEEERAERLKKAKERKPKKVKRKVKKVAVREPGHNW